MKKDDNTIGMFGLGFILTMVSLWFLFDSVRVSTGGHGLFSGGEKTSTTLVACSVSVRASYSGEKNDNKKD